MLLRYKGRVVKKLKLLLVMATLFTVFSLIGCDSDTGSKSGYGTIVIKNVSTNARINWVEIDDIDTGWEIVDERVDIPAKDGSKPFSDISPGKYIVCVWDDIGNNAQSNQITIDAGQTVTLTYNGVNLSR
jgi:hypothetical protein